MRKGRLPARFQNLFQMRFLTLSKSILHWPYLLSCAQLTAGRRTKPRTLRVTLFRTRRTRTLKRSRLSSTTSRSMSRSESRARLSVSSSECYLSKKTTIPEPCPLKPQERLIQPQDRHPRATLRKMHLRPVSRRHLHPGQGPVSVGLLATSPHHTPLHNPTSSSAMAAPSMSARLAQDEQEG